MPVPVPAGAGTGGTAVRTMLLGCMLVLLTHPDRNTQNERRATQSNTRQRTQGKQNQRSRNNTSKPKTNTADPEHYSKPPTTENRILCVPVVFSWAEYGRDILGGWTGGSE